MNHPLPSHEVIIRCSNVFTPSRQVSASAMRHKLPAPPTDWLRVVARSFLVISAIVVAAIPSRAQAAATEAWVARYNHGLTSANGVSSKIVRDTAGDIIVAGYANDGVVGQDMLTIKYSRAEGSVIWQQRYNGPANGNDLAQALAVDGEGNIVVAGTSFAGWDPSGYLIALHDYYLAKYARTGGTLMWERRYRNADESSDVKALFVDERDNVLVVGSAHVAKWGAADGSLRWLQAHSGSLVATGLDTAGNVVISRERDARKYAGVDGHVLWERNYDPGVSVAAGALDSAGNLIVVGATNGWYTAKFAASNGALLWEQRAGFAMAYDIQAARVLAVDAAGDVMVMGYATTGFKAWGWPVFTEYYVAKYAAGNGALRWSRAYPGWLPSSFDAGNNLIVESGSQFAKYDAATGALLAAGEYPFPSGLKVWDGSAQVVVARESFHTTRYVAGTGAVVWQHQFTGPVNLGDYAQAVVVDCGGNVVVTGASQGDAAVDHYTARYSVATGALIWEQRRTGPTNGQAVAQAVAADQKGNVVIAGWDHEPSGTRSGYTMKYAAADGGVVWEKHSPVQAVDVAVDGYGDVLLTGTYRNEGGLNDFCAIKYAGANGAVQWERRYHDRPESSYEAAASALDANGDVIVTGPGRTVKLASSDGRLLWDRPTPFNVQAIAVDRNGNIVVTGSDRTAKYAGADGALLWESSIWAPALALDGDGNVLLTGSQRTVKLAAVDGALRWQIATPIEDAAVAVGARGDVIVTGTSGYTRNAFNYFTAGYSSATGALLWQKIYNGPAKGYEFTRGRRPLAVGPAGIIAVTGYSSAFADPLILFGGSSAYDFATVIYRELPYTSVERVLGGVRLRCFGEPGRTHQLWRSPTVTERGVLVHEQSVPPSGSFEFTETIGPAAASAFYHLEVQP